MKRSEWQSLLLYILSQKPSTIVPGTTSGKSSTPLLLSTGAPTTSKPSTDTPTKPAVSSERPITQTAQPFVVNPAVANGQKLLIQIKTGASVGKYIKEVARTDCHIATGCPTSFQGGPLF